MSATKKVVINTCFGGFGLSEAAYEKLIEWGVPVRGYVEQQRDPATGLYLPEKANDGEVIYDNTLSAKPMPSFGRYWETWTDTAREHPLIVRVVEELGEAASGTCSRLAIVEVPADVAYEIGEYDGREHIAETHRTWYAR